MAVRPIDGDALRKELTCDFTGTPFHGNKKVTIGEVRRIIESMPTLTPTNEWISVDEKLPDEELNQIKRLFPGENEVEVLVMIEGAYIATTLYWDGEKFYDETSTYEVTHWMPLPVPPGKDNNVPINKPLTLEQLREMDGEPVYIPEIECWVLVKREQTTLLFTFSDGKQCPASEWYEQVGPVYRRPPEREENTK